MQLEVYCTPMSLINHYTLFLCSLSLDENQLQSLQSVSGLDQMQPSEFLKFWQGHMVHS
jgi:hypothetical protein